MGSQQHPQVAMFGWWSSVLRKRLDCCAVLELRLGNANHDERFVEQTVDRRGQKASVGGTRINQFALVECWIVGHF